MPEKLVIVASNPQPHRRPYRPAIWIVFRKDSDTARVHFVRNGVRTQEVLLEPTTAPPTGEQCAIPRSGVGLSTPPPTMKTRLL